VLPATVEGRAALRERVAVEHGLAPVSQRQGNEARYCGIRKNTYHLRLVCAIQNLERAQALTAQAANDSELRASPQMAISKALDPLASID